LNNRRLKILVTGGAGYLGSHTSLALLQSGFDVTVLDNLCNSSAESLRRVSHLSGHALMFMEGDICNRAVLDRFFAEHSVYAVLHFAGLKAVGESMSQPLRYYENNVHGSQVLLEAMARAGVFNFVFSSSATVYGEPTQMPISEACPVGRPINHYGRSKLIVEDMLCDLAKSDPKWRIAILRYFNPVGSHESGLIGEDPNGIPNNLLPYIAQVAVGKLPQLTVFGNDYPTHDGTGVRDYIHVIDLAEGHLCALDALKTRIGAHVWNLGTGRGYSVLEILRAFEKASGKSVPYRIAPRRPGDIAACYADPSKAERELCWKAQRSLDEMMRDMWRWQQLNPNGYKSVS
jgi:UDP-glucose 4-epimerase